MANAKEQIVASLRKAYCMEVETVLNYLANSLVLDADGNTHISAPTDNQIDISVNGADDFTC